MLPRASANDLTQSAHEVPVTTTEKLPSVTKDISVSSTQLQDETVQTGKTTKKRVIITNGKASISDRRTQDDAKRFLLTMRSRSTAEAKSRNRALASGLCETLQLLKPEATTENTRNSNGSVLDLESGILPESLILQRRKAEQQSQEHLSSCCHLEFQHHQKRANYFSTLISHIYEVRSPS